MNRLTNYEGKAVVITGATRGIGLDTALVFAAAGAKCYLTYHLGSVDLDEVRMQFEQAGVLQPEIVRCNAISEEETQELFDFINQDFDEVHTWIPNVSIAQLIGDFDDYNKRALFQSIEASAWPLFDGIKRIKQTFGKYPKYAIGISSVGAERYVHNYDFMSASKNVMETLCRYTNYRLLDEDIRINVVRAGMVKSSSLELTFGKEFSNITEELDLERLYLQPREVSNAIFALCSGYMDAISGEVIRVDKGVSFFDTFMRIHSERQKKNENYS